MSFSNLVRSVVRAASDNYTHGRDRYKICKFTPHHMSGVLTGEQCAALFQRSSRDASANYCIGVDGGIVGCVDEEYRSWCSSSRSNDCQAITVEVSNSSYGGNWPISDASWNALVALAVDVCRRHNFRLVYDGTPNGSLTRHNMFSNTDCPGPYLQSRFQELCNVVNSQLDGGIAPTPVPAPSVGRNVGDVVTINGIFTSSNSNVQLHPARNSGRITKIIPGALNPYLLDNGDLGWVRESCIIGASSSSQSSGGKSNEQIAAEVWAGKWGVGEDRKNRLRAAGYDPNVIQSLVNKGVGKNGTVAPSKSTPSKSAIDVAREIWTKGNWGTGDERRRKVEAAGYNYSEVQRYVNEFASGKRK